MQINNVLLNFQEKYFPFYEWLEHDEIKTIKKIKLYKVSSATLNDFIRYKIRLLDETIIEKYNPALFTDDYSFVAIKFDQHGYSIKKSSLTLKDEHRIIDSLDNVKNTKIYYQRISKELKDNDTRKNNEIRKIIMTELKNIEKNKEYEKLAYLYYEWFNESENNYHLMFSKMYEKINNIITSNEVYIYNLIKKTYKLV